ncbi:hypothetical protein CERSUDRAFT_35729, partial [Gelatoporia subvermispora B]
KTVICLSIVAQSTNQKCNALQAMVGIFLHACSTPENVVDLLSRFGLSVSRSTIYSAIKSLSADATKQIKQAGSTLLTGPVYDNFEYESKHLVPTLEKPHDTLIHMTSGMLLRL